MGGGPSGQLLSYIFSLENWGESLFHQQQQACMFVLGISWIKMPHIQLATHVDWGLEEIRCYNYLSIFQTPSSWSGKTSRVFRNDLKNKNKKLVIWVLRRQPDMPLEYGGRAGGSFRHLFSLFMSKLRELAYVLNSKLFHYQKVIIC